MQKVGDKVWTSTSSSSLTGPDVYVQLSYLPLKGSEIGISGFQISLDRHMSREYFVDLNQWRRINFLVLTSPRAQNRTNIYDFLVKVPDARLLQPRSEHFP
jgi:hypothetical protein